MAAHLAGSPHTGTHMGIGMDTCWPGCPGSLCLVTLKSRMLTRHRCLQPRPRPSCKEWRPTVAAGGIVWSYVQMLAVTSREDGL